MYHFLKYFLKYSISLLIVSSLHLPAYLFSQIASHNWYQGILKSIRKNQFAMYIFMSLNKIYLWIFQNSVQYFSFLLFNRIQLRSTCGWCMFIEAEYVRFMGQTLLHSYNLTCIYTYILMLFQAWLRPFWEGNVHCSCNQHHHTHIVPPTAQTMSLKSYTSLTCNSN